MTALTVIELAKDYLKFSIGHFTIFSATERERLHGHNYHVQAVITAEVGPEGLAFNYKKYKEKLFQLCQSIDEYFVLPSASPFLHIEQVDDLLCAHFGEEKIPFLRRDVKLLPIANITVEGLAAWFLGELIKDTATLTADNIHGLLIKISSSPGQSGSASWSLS